MPWYLKVSTGEPPDKPRDIWKCQSDKYGSCVVVMQSAPSRQPLVRALSFFPQLFPELPPSPPHRSLTVKVLRPRAIDSRRGWSFYRGSNAIAKSERVRGGSSRNGSFPSREIETPQSEPDQSATLESIKLSFQQIYVKINEVKFCHRHRKTYLFF